MQRASVVKDGSAVDQASEGAKTVSPRELMRARHPNLFSDASDAIAPRLSRQAFEYHLESLTSRKQEYEFEHFCRKLAEKEICPNLRVQTGPTGGGDSKVDSETYPVAEEVAERWWIGETAAATERWAFAFSAKKAWQPKLRSDIANIISTGRDYKRIYFFTNQFVSDKARAKLEDELLKSSSISVHIVDRNWIVEQVYEHNHLSLAISTLGIDGADDERRRALGPHDVVRLKELEELDAQIADSSRYQAARFQLVEDCLRTAILARGLERPRYEIEGRFARAQQLAQELAIPQQLMRIAYNRAWTAYWWYEDYDAFNNFYQEVENHLVQSSEADDVEKLFNLWHLLSTAESRGFLSSETAQSTARKATLLQLLGSVANDQARPNNALHARTNIAFIGATDAMRAGDTARLDQAWSELSLIVDQSFGMGQYPVESLANMTRELGNFVESNAFDSLFEKVVTLMQQRRSDGTAGVAFRERGIQKLQHDKPYEAIRWIGRAEELLIKEEYQDELIFTLVAASYAYERVGLLWAARNKLLVAVDQSLYAFSKTGEMPASTLRILQRLVWIELQIGRVPHVLQAMSWAGLVARQVNLTDESKAPYEDEVRMQEGVLGIHLLRSPLDALQWVEQLPDALERLGLAMSRMPLLYALGHEKRIREEYIPHEQDQEDLKDFFLRWLDQPAAKDLPQFPNFIESSKTSLRSVILGSEFLILVPSDPTSLSLAESLLGALEAFLATSDEGDIVPHAERTTIAFKVSDDIGRTPVMRFVDKGDADAEVVRPTNLVFEHSEDMANFSEWLRDSVAMVAAHRFFIRDPESWMRRIAGEENAFSRAVALGDVLTTSRNIFGQEPRTRLSDWLNTDDIAYECLRSSPWYEIEPSDSLPSAPTKALKIGVGPAPSELMDGTRRKHTERQVLSPINTPLWDRAKWRGTLFAMAEHQPPVLALIFQDEQAGCSIFEAWRARWGMEDRSDALRVLIVTGLSARNPAHYAVAIGPNIQGEVNDVTKTFLLVSRINRMTPTTSQNLDAFLASYRRFGRYLLAPATMGSPPSLATTLFFGKHHLHVRQAWEISDNDLDAMVLADDDDPIIPAGVSEAPVTKALEWIRGLRKRHK